MNTGRLSALIRHGRGRLTLAVLLLVLAAVVLSARPRLDWADEPVGHSDRTIVGRIADVLGDTVFETGAPRSAIRHAPVVGGPSQPDGTASDGRLTATARGGTP
ncbi:hypothetical protein ABZ766_03535 [Streptomyces sp. NPDC006670]|uniref:hypothetical protein n=1 Tax=Streptomyces sp. NPDC006670 TaxID=3154476 RepID=UPI0033CD1111